MGQLRFRSVTCFAAIAMTGFDGVVALWPDVWKGVATGRWGMALGPLLGVPFFMAPAVAVIQFRFRQVSRTLTAIIGAVSSMFVWRLVGSIADPTSATDLARQAFDPLVAPYLALFCLPCLVAALRG